jgi:hypothetical protein
VSRWQAAGLLSIAAAAVVTAVLAGSAAAAVWKPDHHDRVLAAQLATKALAFKKLAGDDRAAKALQKSLTTCPAFKGNGTKAFAAAFASIPVLMIYIVQHYDAQLHELQAAFTSMRADSPLFARWLSLQGKSVALILKFDTHGKPVDGCKATTVLLDKKSTRAQISRALGGLDPSLIVDLFQSKVNSELTAMGPKMQSFFVAAGLSKADAKAMTS